MQIVDLFDDCTAPNVLSISHINFHTNSNILSPQSTLVHPFVALSQTSQMRLGLLLPVFMNNSEHNFGQ